MLDTAQALPHLAYYVFAVQSEVALFPALSGKGAMFRCAIARRVVLASWASREHAGLFWGFGNGTFCWMGLIQAPRTDALETMRTRMPFSQWQSQLAISQSRNLGCHLSGPGTRNGLRRRKRWDETPDLPGARLNGLGLP